MAVFPALLANWTADQTLGLFRDAFNASRQDGATFIHTGSPTSLVGRLNQATARQACRRWARKLDTLPADKNAAYDTACRPYLESIGEYPGTGIIRQDFRGGQCPGVGYIVTMQGNNACPGGTTSTLSRNGPLGGFVIGNAPGNDCQGNPGRRPGILVDGQFVGGSLTAIRQADAASWRVVSVTRVDGQPDNCGNPPITVTPPPPVTTPLPPIRVRPDVNIDVTIDVDIGPDGSIDIDFNPEFELEPDVTIDPFGGDGGGSGGTPTAPPGDRGNPGDDFDSGEETPEGEAPPGQVLTGVLIDAISIADFVNKTELPSATVYRGVCYVLMGGEPGVDLQPEGSTVVFPQFFEAPENSTKWRVYANVGYRLRVTPYYREVEEG
jgi:hypothetical protein